MLQHARGPRRRTATALLATILLPLSVLTAPVGVGPGEGGMLALGWSDGQEALADTTVIDPAVLGVLPLADRYEYAVGGTSPAAVIPGAPNLGQEHVRPLASLVDAVGVEHESVLDAATIERAAEALGVEIERPIVPEDVDTLLAAQRDRLALVLTEVGVSVEEGVDDGALLEAAEIAGVEVEGETVTPVVVEQIAEGVEEWAHENVPTEPFATDAGVDLYIPSKHAVMIGYHQASFPVSRQMSALETDTSTTTLPPRGRGTGRRTAVDISVEAGTSVLAPATGKVVEVQSYALYGRYADAKIRIVPDDNPEMLASIVHVTAPKVSVGDEVEGGTTVIAEQGTKFPFVSQIDRFAGNHPHVHIEIRER